MDIKTYARIKLLFENSQKGNDDISFRYGEYFENDFCNIVIIRDNKMDHTTNSKLNLIFYNVKQIMKKYDIIKEKVKRNKFNTGFYKRDFKIKRDILEEKIKNITLHNMKLLELLYLYYEKFDLESFDLTLTILNYTRLEAYEEIEAIQECYSRLIDTEKKIEAGEEIYFK